MKPLIMLGGIGLIGYAVYEYLYGHGVAVPVAPASNTGVVPAPVAPTPTPTLPAPGITAAQLTTAAGGAAMLNADQWNYFYSAVSGIPQTADLFTAGNRGEFISVNTYLARRQSHGLGWLTGPRKLTYV